LNIKEYIASGILEAYVLGEVSDQEKAELEANLLRYPELKDELARVEDAQEAMLMHAAIVPPIRVKQQILSRIEDGKTSVTNPSVVRSEKQVSFTTETSAKWWQFATAASVTIALIATYYAIDYKSQLSSTRQSLNALQAQNQQIAQDYNVVNQRLDNIENTIKIIDNPAYKRIIMRGTETAQGSIASIYWNESTNEVYMSIQNLRQLSKDQQYQLWAIVDGKPVDAGIFDLTANLLKMKEIRNASAFAVTVEPTGGSVSPTLSSMQVIGTI
jgi:anti-sigma-K factor RskA